MDEPNAQLIAVHGYCTQVSGNEKCIPSLSLLAQYLMHTQELVNLILTGTAVSNAFDDVITLDAGSSHQVCTSTCSFSLLGHF